MRHASATSRRLSAIGPTDVGERVCAYLRRRHAVRTVDNVVADLAAWGVKHSTVGKMLERRTAPGVMLWLALIDVYGPDFLAAAHPARLGWLDEAARAQRKAALEVSMAALKAEMERL